MDINIKKLETLFREATELRDKGELVKAAEQLEKALTLNPLRRAPILGTLAHIYFLNRDLDKARICYKEATALSPNSELASLGYFHTLWNLGREWDAYAEGKRFLSIRDSEEYFLMVEEMRDAFEAAGIDVRIRKKE